MHRWSICRILSASESTFSENWPILEHSDEDRKRPSTNFWSIYPYIRLKIKLIHRKMGQKIKQNKATESCMSPCTTTFLQ